VGVWGGGGGEVEGYNVSLNWDTGSVPQWQTNYRTDWSEWEEDNTQSTSHTPVSVTFEFYFIDGGLWYRMY